MLTARPTLRTLAAEAGVSPMTVSLALRNSREVSARTRARLQRLAAARGYRPDPHLAKLMHHLRIRRPARSQANICALLQSWPEVRSEDRSYFTQLNAGLHERAESLGYSFGTLRLDDYPRPRQLQRVLEGRGVEGLLLLPMRRPVDLAGLLDWEKFATVAVTSSVSAPRFHSVTPNHFDNMITVCQQLTRAGFRRIGLAVPQDWDVRVRHRWTGGITWQNHFGGTSPVAPLIGRGTGLDVDAAALADWLAREQPDAVIFEALDRTALGEALRKIPPRRRPCIVTMNWPSSGARMGIDQNVGRIGAVAVELLAGMLARGEKGIPALPSTTMLDGRWAGAALPRPPLTPAPAS